MSSVIAEEAKGMSKVAEKSGQIKVDGKSWVIQLPDTFTSENSLESGTQVLLTFKNDLVEAEILPPLPPELKEIAESILEKRKGAYEEMRRIGD